ncbi:MAG TPA: hypothetical protein VK002_11100 [Rubricoccaceae bacterium]|nr:hypothetical protein [Rubricoccaceae bacterium]
MTSRTDYERLDASFREALEDDLDRDSRIARYGYALAFYVLGLIAVEELIALRDLLGLTSADVDALDL